MSDILARLNVCCRDLIAIFEANFVPSAVIDRLNSLIDTREHFEFLEIALGFRKTMAFLDHELVLEKLVMGFNLMDDSLVNEKKNLMKKIKALDEKKDAELIEKLTATKNIVEEKRAKSMILYGQLRMESRVPLHHFAEDKNFDAFTYAKKLAPETWINKTLGR